MSKKNEKIIMQRESNRKIVYKLIKEAKGFLSTYDESLQEKLLAIKLPEKK